MLLLNIYDISLPITDPVLRFLVVILIVLLSPLLLNRLRMPNLLGLILAGALVGPNGLGILPRDSSIVVSGTTGLLYIMFLAGLEIDLADFKKNSVKSLTFGLYTFILPMILGTLAGLYVLHFSLITSILLASMLASHTLIAYPIISKMGVAKDKAVNITVGGTMITDTLALLVLAVIVGMTKGEVTTAFWLRMSISITVFGLIVLLVFPLIGRWFFKQFDDKISQYIFVLVMVYLGAVLAELAGIEAIIGAFLTGLALNRLVPHTSSLMNRIEFVGNAIFIPFFLISVGMLIDYKAFIKDLDTLKVAATITVVVIAAKFIAAWLAQKTFRFSPDQRSLIFSLSVAQAAATLATVLVGYNTILSETESGEPVRLLNESVLNGSILMILVTCTIAGFVAQRGARNIALADVGDTDETPLDERILIALNNIDTADDLVDLSATIKSKSNTDGLYALNVIQDDDSESAANKTAQKLIQTAVTAAAAIDLPMQGFIRYDPSIANSLTSVVKEYKITDLILGLHDSKGISDSFLGNLTEGILKQCDTTTLIYKPSQPLSTVKRHIIVVPDQAEREIGFPFWLIKMWNIGRHTGSKLIFFSSPETLEYIRNVQLSNPIDCDFIDFTDWHDFLILTREVQRDDNLIVVLSRQHALSYTPAMDKVPTYLNKYFKQTSFILIYPIQQKVEPTSLIVRRPGVLHPAETLDEIRHTLTELFKRK